MNPVQIRADVAAAKKRYRAPTEYGPDHVATLIRHCEALLTENARLKRDLGLALSLLPVYEREKYDARRAVLAGSPPEPGDAR